MERLDPAFSLIFEQKMNKCEKLTIMKTDWYQLSNCSICV